MKPGLFGGGQPFPPRLWLPPAFQASLQSRAPLMDIGLFPPLHSKPPTGIPLGNNPLPQQLCATEPQALLYLSEGHRPRCLPVVSKYSLLFLLLPPSFQLFSPVPALESAYSGFMCS